MTNDAPASFPALAFDPEAYRHFVADFDLTETQQRELLEAVWFLVVSHVDRGFNLHPVQQAIAHVDSCANTLEPDSTPVIAYKDAFKDNAVSKSRRKPKGPRGGKEDS